MKNKMFLCMHKNERMGCMKAVADPILGIFYCLNKLTFVCNSALTINKHEDSKGRLKNHVNCHAI